MISRVILSSALVSLFRKKAVEAYPKEVMMTLWGRIEGDSVIVARLRNIEQEATEDNINFDTEHAVAPAAVMMERYLGSIHSHPDLLDPSPSCQDWEDSFHHGEHIFGVMAVAKKPNGRFETHLGWWEPRPMIVQVNLRNKPWTKTVKTSSPSEPSSRDISTDSQPQE